MNRLDYRAGDETTSPELQYIEIPLGRSKRWKGLVGYVLFFAGVCALLVWMFARFTTSMRLAVGLVLFMVTYMGLMGWWTGRNMGGR